MCSSLYFFAFLTQIFSLIADNAKISCNSIMFLRSTCYFEHCSNEVGSSVTSSCAVVTAHNTAKCTVWFWPTTTGRGPGSQSSSQWEDSRRFKKIRVNEHYQRMFTQYVVVYYKTPYTSIYEVLYRKVSSAGNRKGSSASGRSRSTRFSRLATRSPHILEESYET